MIRNNPLYEDLSLKSAKINILYFKRWPSIYNEQRMSIFIWRGKKQNWLKFWKFPYRDYLYGNLWFYTKNIHSFLHDDVEKKFVT